MLESNDLVDRIYECSLLPELWPGVLDALAAIAKARGGFLLNANGSHLRWIASDSINDGLKRLSVSGLLPGSLRVRRLVGARHAGFLREPDLFTDEELESDPIYRQILWPVGLGWAAATAIQVPTGDMLYLSLEAERVRGPIDPSVIPVLDDLRPHLARSALIAARLHFEKVRIAGETLAALGLPAIVLDDQGAVMASNSLADGMRDIVTWRAHDRLVLKDSKADALLRLALQSLRIGAIGPVRSFAVRHASLAAGMVAHVVPIRGHARDLFARSAAILVLTPVTMPEGPPIELVQSLFDLTPAEARVARALVSGNTVDEIAEANRVSANTIKTQIRGVLEKSLPRSSRIRGAAERHCPNTRHDPGHLN